MSESQTTTSDFLRFACPDCGGITGRRCSKCGGLGFQLVPKAYVALAPQAYGKKSA